MKSTSSLYDSVCAVTVSLANKSGGKLEGSSSSILIDSKHGLVITHASILYHLAAELSPGKLATLRRTGAVRGPFFERKADVEIILPNINSETVLADNRNDVAGHNIQLSLLKSKNQNVQSFSKYRASMKMIFECQNLRHTIENTLPSDTWQFSDDTVSESSEKADTDSEKADDDWHKKKLDVEVLKFHLLPCFVLIELKDFHSSKQFLPIRSARYNRQGDPVEICATPFGGLSPEVFLNSRSLGIISNMAGPRGVLIMTDARCVPGSEGGALFCLQNGQRQLTGIMIASLCWKSNEWVGLSMACAMSELMGSLQGHLVLDDDQSVTLPNYAGLYGSNFVDDISQLVSFVHVGHSWGSAVCVDPTHGIYLTCSHVLIGMDTLGVTISHHTGGGNKPCQVIYRTPQHSHFDLAVIKLLGDTDVKQSSERVGFGKVQEGDMVYVVGHAIFGSSHNLAPTVTRGTISKIVRYNNIPVMLQTTCGVHAGVSGGGVYSVQGQLVGIVVCNSKDTVSGACFPHINMCIPMETIALVIRHYLKTQEKSFLHNLHIQNKRIDHLWTIGTESETLSRL